MASKIVLLNALYDQFTDFVKQLGGMYPNDADFAAFAVTLKMLRSTNPSLLAKYIVDNIEQYESEIMSKNENFFLSHDYEQYTGVDIQIFSKLKMYVANMNSETKENVWKYIQNIYRLAKAVNSASS
jgi:hypothetical protein